MIQAYRNAYGGLPREVWILSFALLINRSGSMVLAFLPLYLTERLGFTIFEAGAIFSVYGLGSIAGSWISGNLIKHVGAIRIQIICLAMAAPCFAIVPLFSSMLSVAIAIFWMSFFSEAVRPANNVAVVQFTKPEMQTRAFGLQRMALNLGLSVGPAVGGFLSVVHFESLFFVDGVTTLFGAWFLYQMFGFRKLIASKNSNEAAQAKTLEGQGSPLRDGHFVVFLLLILAVSIIFFQFHATYPVYLTEHYSMTKPMLGMLYALNTVIIVVFEMLLLNGVKRFRLLPTIGWGAFLSCFGFAILPLSQAILFAAFSMVIITIGEMLMFPLATGFVAKRSAGRDVGMYMSWYAMTYSVTSVVAPLVGTTIYGANPHAIWWVAGVVSLLTLSGFYLLQRSLNASKSRAGVASDISDIVPDEPVASAAPDKSVKQTQDSRA